MALACLWLMVGSGCQPAERLPYQAYFEGEFVLVASPVSGRLEALEVTRGSRVEEGALLFALEGVAEKTAEREAESRVEQARARLEDLRKGQRPTELAALEARFAQARAAADLSALELRRGERLFASDVLAADDFDRVRLTDERNRRVLDELTAQLETARMGARPDVIAAAEAELAAAVAAHERAAWAVEQTRPAAPAGALVYDTLYEPGEYVAAGRPVVSLLPPANIKVRFFVPEADVASLRPGQAVQVSHTGAPQPLEARISMIFPRPEFTPPVLYNRENRAKLVFMVEAVFAPEVAAGLHPGQPADVWLEAGE